MRVLQSCVCVALLVVLGLVVVPAAAQVPANGSILVLPFSIPPLSPESWIGKGMQQDLLTDLERGTTARISAPATAPAAVDSTAALAAARQAGASFVVFGQAQYNGTEVRFTGQILDVATAKPLAELKATGPLSQLFHLEDAIVGQTLAGLPRAMLTPAAVAAMSPAAAPPPPPYVPPTANADNGQQTAGTEVQTSPIAPSDDSYYPQISDTGPAYWATAPLYSYSYGYGCAVPAYTYAGPYCDLYPYYGGGYGYIGGYGYGGRYDRGFGRNRGFDRGRGGSDRGRGNTVAGRGDQIGGGAAIGNRGFSAARAFSGAGRVGGFRSAAAGVARSSGGGGAHGGGGGRR